MSSGAEGNPKKVVACRCRKQGNNMGGVRCFQCSCNVSFLRHSVGDVVLFHTFWFG